MAESAESIWTGRFHRIGKNSTQIWPILSQKKKFKFFFIKKIHIIQLLVRTLQYLKKKKLPLKTWKNRPQSCSQSTLFFQYCKKWLGLPRHLKTHIAFSMFPILDTNLWRRLLMLSGKDHISLWKFSLGRTCLSEVCQNMTAPYE